MHESFHGWQRKSGCVALMLALTVTAAWVRSEIVVDEFGVQSKTCAYLISSSMGSVHSQTVWSPDGTDIGDEWELIEWCSISIEMLNENELALRSPLFDFVRRDGMQWISIPYWSIALPLTALSAYLLLRRPRLRGHDLSPPSVESLSI